MYNPEGNDKGSGMGERGEVRNCVCEVVVRVRRDGGGACEARWLVCV